MDSWDRPPIRVPAGAFPQYALWNRPRPEKFLKDIPDPPRPAQRGYRPFPMSRPADRSAAVCRRRHDHERRMNMKKDGRAILWGKARSTVKVVDESGEPVSLLYGRAGAGMQVGSTFFVLFEASGIRAKKKKAPRDGTGGGDTSGFVAMSGLFYGDCSGRTVPGAFSFSPAD